MSKHHSASPGDYPDKQEIWNEHFDHTRRREIAALIDDEVTSEHEKNPIGYRDNHSPKLQRVLNYMRVQPLLGKYFVYPMEPWKDYRIAIIAERGQAPDLLDGHQYRSEEEAMHGVFLLRSQDIIDSVVGEER